MAGDEAFFPLPEFGHPIQRTVMPLVTLAEGRIVSVGTGFVIQADGLLATAKHVLQFAFRHKTRRANESGEWQDSYELYALYLTNRHHEGNKDGVFGGLWPIDYAWLPNELDIGYCMLRKAIIEGKSATFSPLKLSFRLPTVGEQITGFGYYRGKGEIVDSLAEQPTAEYSHDTAFTRGKIIEVFPVRRDGSLLPFPCFRTDARFEPGMSGGPVCNEKGHVCGVICSSMPPTQDDPGYVSHASLLWPMLGTFIEVSLNEAGPARRVSINELIRAGLIATDGSEDTVGIESRADGSTTIFIKG